MSYQEERLQEIADAIREVKGTTEKIPATNFASEIVGLSVVRPSGIITIKENGTHNVANYEWAEVSVEADLNERVIIGKWGAYVNIDDSWVFEFLIDKTFKLNGGMTTITGTYVISGTQIIMTVNNDTVTVQYDSENDTIDMSGDILFRMPTVSANLTTKEITENGTYKASDDGADGYSEIVVNVSSGGGSGADSSSKIKSLDLFCGTYTISQYLGFDNHSNLEAVLSDNFDASNATTAQYMFNNNTNLVRLPKLNTSNVTTMKNMFNGCSNLIEILQLDTSSLTDASNMFYGCSKLTTIPLLQTNKVTVATSMFSGCSSLIELPLLDFSSLTTVNSLFNNCKALRIIPQLDFSKSTSAYSMFQGCTSLETIPLINISKATELDNMFKGCTSLITIPQLDISNGKTMSSIFYNCTNLQSIPKLNTSQVTTLNEAFRGCTNLTTIEGLDCTSVTNFNNTFSSCTNLTNLTLKNIKRTGLTIGSGTSYGHLLTVDSLVNTIKELWAYTSGSYKLTMGTANTAKLADIYVKLITATDEMIAADPNINSKMPCEVCSSTDEGAMLITDYATLKKWTIA